MQMLVHLPPLAYTSHSFKATCLSYLAKMGAGFSDRLALGYHVDQIAMALRYSRDGAQGHCAFWKIVSHSCVRGNSNLMRPEVVDLFQWSRQAVLEPQ